MNADLHRSAGELQAGIQEILKSPANLGPVRMIVIRPERDARLTPESANVVTNQGMVGDRWMRTCSRKLEDGTNNPDTQLTLMNSRAAGLIAGGAERWPLAGDNLVVDLDLSLANLPVGQRLKIGGAVLEISAEPHTGCVKFSKRFGPEALKFVNSPEGRSLRLRGVNAMIVKSGEIRLGDLIEKL